MSQKSLRNGRDKFLEEKIFYNRLIAIKILWKARISLEYLLGIANRRLQLVSHAYSLAGFDKLWRRWTTFRERRRLESSETRAPLWRHFAADKRCESAADIDASSWEWSEKIIFGRQRKIWRFRNRHLHAHAHQAGCLSISICQTKSFASSMSRRSRVNRDEREF